MEKKSDVKLYLGRDKIGLKLKYNWEQNEKG